eukprot:TRINITY_DN1541_c0_g1_i6.p1 TRINITY_DN1541_c0_g1~~TRINITY_DN1541_c0_g1_i6.p1  ORF type:complete len:547 (+),score=95.44 TRINITY_DN1541_c0_g1_i6:2527-4167(+)
MDDYLYVVELLPSGIINCARAAHTQQRCQLNVTSHIILDRSDRADLNSVFNNMNVYIEQGSSSITYQGGNLTMILNSSSLYNYGSLSLGTSIITDVIFISDGQTDNMDFVNYGYLYLYNTSVYKDVSSNKIKLPITFTNHKYLFFYGLSHIEGINFISCNDSVIIHNPDATIQFKNMYGLDINFDGVLAVLESGGFPGYNSQIFTFDNTTNFYNIHGNISYNCSLFDFDKETLTETQYTFCFLNSTLSGTLYYSPDIQPSCATRTTPNAPLSLCPYVPQSQNFTPTPTPTPNPTPTLIPTSIPTLMPSPTPLLSDCSQILVTSAPTFNCSINSTTVVISTSGNITSIGVPTTNTSEKLVNSSLLLTDSDVSLLQSQDGHPISTIINGNLSLSNTSLTLISDTASELKVQGSLTIDNLSELKIDLSSSFVSDNSVPPITVSGCIDLYGKININIPVSKSQIITKKNLTVVQSSCINQDSNSMITANLDKERCTYSNPTTSRGINNFLYIVIQDVNCVNSNIQNNSNKVNHSLLVTMIIYLTIAVFIL